MTFVRRSWRVMRRMFLWHAFLITACLGASAIFYYLGQVNQDKAVSLAIIISAAIALRAYKAGLFQVMAVAILIVLVAGLVISLIQMTTIVLFAMALFVLWFRSVVGLGRWLRGGSSRVMAASKTALTIASGATAMVCLLFLPKLGVLIGAWVAGIIIMAAITIIPSFRRNSA